MKSTTSTPAADARPKPACPADANGVPLDNGTPVLIGQNRHYFFDGSYETHNGYEPLRVAPPADYIRRCVHKRAYHRAKFRLAESVLRQLRAVLRPGTSFTFTWDERVAHWFGPPPRTPQEAEARMALVTEWHADKVRVLEERLHERGIDPEAADV